MARSAHPCPHESSALAAFWLKVLRLILLGGGRGDERSDGRGRSAHVGGCLGRGMGAMVKRVKDQGREVVYSGGISAALGRGLGMGAWVGAGEASWVRGRRVQLALGRAANLASTIGVEGSAGPQPIGITAGGLVVLALAGIGGLVVVYAVYTTTVRAWGALSRAYERWDTGGNGDMDSTDVVGGSTAMLESLLLRNRGDMVLLREGWPDGLGGWVYALGTLVVAFIATLYLVRRKRNTNYKPSMRREWSEARTSTGGYGAQGAELAHRQAGQRTQVNGQGRN